MDRHAVTSGSLPFPLFQQIIQKVAFDALDRLPASEANFVAGRMYVNCGSPQTRDRQWGEHHAKDEDKLPALLKSLQDNASNNLAKCAACAQPFIEGIRDSEHKASILRSIETLPPGEMEDILAHAKHLIADLGSTLYCARGSIGHPMRFCNLLHPIAAIPQDRRAAFLEELKPLIRDPSHSLQEHGCNWIHISQLISQATPVFLHEGSVEQRAVIFNKIAQVIPLKHRIAVFNIIGSEAYRTLTQNMAAESKSTFLLQLLDLIAEEPCPENKAMRFKIFIDTQSLTLLDSIRAMPADERQKLLHVVRYDDPFPQNSARMLQRIMAFPAIERMEIAALLTGIQYDDRIPVVDCLEILSKEERKLFLNFLAKLKVEPPDSHSNEIIAGIRQLAEEIRFDVLLWLLMVDPRDRWHLFDAIRSMPAPVAQEAVVLLQKIPPHDMHLVYTPIRDVIANISDSNTCASIIKALRIICLEQSNNATHPAIPSVSIIIRLCEWIVRLPPSLRLAACTALSQMTPDLRNQLFLSENRLTALVTKNLFHVMTFAFPPQYHLEILQTIGRMRRDNREFDQNTPFVYLILTENPNLIAPVHDHLMRRLCSVTNRHEVYEAARWILSGANALQLQAADPLAQMARNMSEWMQPPEENNPKCPYRIYQKHEFAARSPLASFQPEGQRVGDHTLALVPPTFQTKANLDNPITFAHLPSGILPNTLVTLFNALTQRVNAMPPAQRQAVQTYIRESTTFSYNALGNNLTSNFFRSLLATAGDAYNHIPAPASNATVPVTAARFFAIMRFILDQSPVVTPGQHLSPREDALLKMSASIQECSIGIKEGITLAYDQLAPHYHYQTGTRRDAATASAQEQLNIDKTDRAEAYLNREIQKLLTTLLSENNDLLQELIPTPYRVQGNIITRGQIAQLSHQATYLKNFIGRFVGLKHSVEFDPHAGVLDDTLIQRSWDGTLAIFYRHFTPQFLIRMLRKAINRDIKDREHFPYLFTDLQLMANRADANEVWDTDEEANLELSERGAELLLINAGYLTRTPR